jgi:hypothetical protein
MCETPFEPKIYIQRLAKKNHSPQDKQKRAIVGVGKLI